MTQLFVYGPEMNPAVMRHDLGVGFISRERAQLLGFRLSFNVPDITAPGAGLANILGDPRESVEGALYEVPEEALEHLDGQHGINDGRYNRVVLTVTNEAGEQTEAEVYVGDEQVYHDGLQPTKEAVRNMLEAADILDAEYRTRLHALTVVEA